MILPVYVFDQSGLLLSAVYDMTEAEYASRQDYTAVPPPAETQTTQAKWTGSEWVLVDRIAAAPPVYATPEQVQARLLEYEMAPIEIFGAVIDCDDRSEKLMRDALASWDVRELDGEWFSSVYDGDTHVRVLRWKLTDNSLVQFTKEQLQLVYHQMLLARAARAQRLWIKAQQYKVDPPLLADIATIEGFLGD